MSELRLVNLEVRTDMKLVIVIEAEGEAMDSMFAVGPNDLRNHFIPEWMGFKPDDIKRIHFEELRRDGKIISIGDAILGEGKYEKITHKENFTKSE